MKPQRFFAAALAVLMCFASVDAWAGWTGAVCAWGQPDCNRCVPDAAASVNNLRDHGDVLGFYPQGDPVTSANHWQGIQRLAVGDGRYLAVSQSGSARAFHVVEMGSRNTTGARLRSNRLTPGLNYPDTGPPGSDRVVLETALPAGMSYNHAGGMQSVGKLLAVPLEGGSNPRGLALVYDLGNPQAPLLLNASRYSDTAEAGTASLAKLNDGRFLLIIGRGNANTLEFYLSRGNIADNNPTELFDPVDIWNEGELGSEIGDWEFGNYQSLNLITQCDGSLFLVGTHKNALVGGEDWVDLFRLGTQGVSDAVITKVAKKHLYCGYPSPGASSGTQLQCNLDAAGGVYVDPAGQLIVYATEHDNDGPGGSVKMMEFRSIFPNANCGSDIQQAFVELYDDSDFSDRGLTIDYPDRNLEDYSNFKRIEGFNDKTSAVRYCIPPGHFFRLYDDTGFRDNYRDFYGSGSVILNQSGFSDKASSGRFLP